MILVLGLWTFLRAVLTGSAAVALENLALRHQLAVPQRSGRRPRLLWGDRILWVWLSPLWVGWRASLGAQPQPPAACLATWRPE